MPSLHTDEEIRQTLPSLVLGGRRPPSADDAMTFRQSTERLCDRSGPPSLVLGGRTPKVDRPPPYEEPLHGPPSLVVGERWPQRSLNEGPPPYSKTAQGELGPPSLYVGGRLNGGRFPNGQDELESGPSLYRWDEPRSPEEYASRMKHHQAPHYLRRRPGNAAALANIAASSASMYSSNFGGGGGGC